MASKEDDYTKYRTVGNIPYSVDDKIGRKDPTYVQPVTTSGIDVDLPGVLLRSA